MFGLYVLIAQYLQLVLGLSPWEAGLATVPSAIASAIGALSAPAFTSRIQKRGVLMIGLLIAVAGFLLLGFGAGHWGVPGVVASTVIFSLGLASGFTPAYEMIVTSAPPERSGAASAMAETVSELSGALGIAVLGSLSAAVYRSLLSGALPANLSTADAQAVSTLGGASSVATTLPTAIAGPLLTSARAAFSAAMQFSAAAAATAVVAGCIVVMRLGRARQQVNARTAGPS
jgi:DHA2 family multidrug resistance protein-like MFS transporter